MRLLEMRFALLFAVSALGVPVVVHAGPQWSGIKGRALIEQVIRAPTLTNVFGIPTPANAFSPSSFVTVRSPIKTVIRIYGAKSGRLVRTVNTDDSGRFVVLLQPGLYRLEPAVIHDGRILGPGDGFLLDVKGIIQTAPTQTVRVSGFRYSQVTVVYHTVWPLGWRIPSRPIRTVPVTGPVYPVGNVPPPQPTGSIRILSGSISSLSGRTLPPPPSPLTQSLPPSVPPMLPPLPQR